MKIHANLLDVAVHVCLDSIETIAAKLGTWNSVITSYTT